MSNISLIFPPQQTLSIKETINTDLPEFIPHYEVIFMGISDLFRSKLQSLTPSDQSYLDSLKSSSDNDKAIASEIALWHHQTDYALQCVTDIENNALCKRMQLMLTKTGEDRKQLKDADAQPFERDDEYKFVLLDYNFQTFSGSTADSNAIDVLLKTELNNMNTLISNGNCNWRFHLLYASLLCRISLDSNAVQQQIDLAQTKLGSDANSHYAYQALTGDIYIKMRQFDKGRAALLKAVSIMKNDGYCRSRLIYSYLYENNYNKAIEIWNGCRNDLSQSGVPNELLDCYTNYINLNNNLDDEKNNESIMSWNGDETNTFVATPLKLFIMAYKSGQFVGDDKFGIVETDEFNNSMSWTDKQNDNAQSATHLQRMVASFIKFFVDMFTNDDIESWDMQGPVLDNVFSSFQRPLFDDILDALSLENYLLGMFKLRWKGDCKNAFRFSIICNCQLNMNSYIGEVIGFQNAGSSDIAVEKIKEIQKFINVEALELMPIDAKRMNLDDEKNCMDAQNDLINLINKNNQNYDALLALSDIYISNGQWQSSLLLMQQPVQAECKLCNKNLELKMKWGTVLFFNGYLPLANQIFKDYATKDFEASAHQYYCGIAANILYELGKQKDLDKMHLGEKLKGQNLWMYRYLCYKYWVEFFVKKKKSKKKRPKQPKTGGKSQYDKAIDCAKKMIRLNEDFPLGHALLARSNIELIESVDGMSDKIEESVNKAVELADQCLQSKLILPRLYYETLIHCGVAMYQIGKDGSSYYNKAVDNTPHGETTLMKLQRERITSKMDTQATRELLLEIQNKNLNMDGYKKALPLFEYDFNKTVNLANNWDIFTPKSELPETGQLGMNITKPDANPNGDKPPKKKKKKAAAKSMVPDTDDSKGDIPPPPPLNNGIPPPPSGGNGGDDMKSSGGDGQPLESVFKYANLCSNSWPTERLTYSLPFDDATTMGDALILLLRKLMSDIGLAPQDENDLIGKLHWGGENALQDVMDKCEGKNDPMHLGLANFAYTYKVDMGLGSDEHITCIDNMMNVTKNLTYEGRVGFAALKGLQCISFEADELFKEVSSMKDADGLDWLYWRHFGQYLLIIKQDFNNAINAFEKAYKTNPKKDPMTIGWYITALSKSGNPQNKSKIAAIFDEIGKYHENNTDVAVIREEFLNNFDIKTSLIYESLCKSGSTPFMQARKLICMAKYQKNDIKDIAPLCKGIKPSGGKMFKILIAFMITQAQWVFNNSLKQCIDGMTKAGTSCMDWTLGAAFTSFCFAKKGDWDSAIGGIDCLPTKTFDPIIFQCAGMLTDGLTEDIEMNKSLSPFMFIGRINNLRFGKKKDTTTALKELISEYLTKFSQDFNGLVALGDIWLSMGAIVAAYQIYYTVRQLYPLKYKQNFVLRMKFAECMRLNGFQNEALCEFRDSYGKFDENDKGFADEMNEISDLVIGYALLCITIGDYECAEKLLKVSNKRHILNKLAKNHLALLINGTDSDKCKSVYNTCKDFGDNPLMLALAVRAGKISGDDTGALESKLKELISGKYSGINSIIEYCSISIGLSSDSSNECLTNNILIKCINEGVGNTIYSTLKDLYSKNNYPSNNDIFQTIGSIGVNNTLNDISINKNAIPVQIADITNDYNTLNTQAMKEIDDIKSGKIQSSKSGPKSGKKSSKKRKSESIGPNSGGSVKAGPKPKIDYNKTSLSEKKKWSFQMCDNLPTPNSTQVKNWSVNQISEFISKVPIFGLNEWYGKKFKESGVNGKMFLDCNEAKLIKWGIDRKCHRARYRAEALAMKRRG